MTRTPMARLPWLIRTHFRVHKNMYVACTRGNSNEYTQYTIITGDYPHLPPDLTL